MTNIYIKFICLEIAYLSKMIFHFSTIPIMTATNCKIQERTIVIVFIYLHPVAICPGARPSTNGPRR